MVFSSSAKDGKGFVIVPNPSAGVNAETVAALEKVGVTRWTRMQEEAMAKLYDEDKKNSSDGLICAATGSGKTYAFLMPVLMRFLLDEEEEEEEDGGKKDGVKAIALLPTRELAQQVFEKARSLFEETNGIRVSLCVGGLRSHDKDAEDISKRKPKLVIGTPGRMLELKKLNVLDVSKIEVQILDEIDRLLDGGFENDVLDVLRPPGACQTICATATARGNLRRFLNKTLAFGYKEIGGKITVDENGFEVHKNSGEIGGNVAHCACALAKGNSDNETAQVYAKAILTAFRGFVATSSTSTEEKSQCLCFVETKSLCDKIEVALQKEINVGTVNQEFQVRSLHSSLPQSQRDFTLLEARRRSIDIIVATDVASRGIDLPGVELVIHCGFPKDSESYVHRSGRAGRPGCNTRGCALILHSPEDGGKVSAFIEAETNVRVKRLMDVREARAFVIDDNREKSDASFKEERTEREKKERLGENILITQRFQMLDEELDGLSMNTSKKGGAKKKKGKR